MSVSTNKSETILQTLAKLRIQQQFSIKKSTKTNLVTMMYIPTKCWNTKIKLCRNPTEGHHQIHRSFKGITLYNAWNYFILHFIKCSTHWRILWNNQQMQPYAVNFIPVLGSLYMFRVFYTPIIRSTIFNCIYSHWYKPYCKVRRQCYKISW